ncbi:CMRF35-like molecule 1 isoform X2 [Esox lucius]|nr:CMRF35-like molecule 1 isoform X2 [Esox lucius]
MGVEGGPVYIRCSHTWAWSTIKYFCKGTCSGQDILIKTTDRERSSEKERYSIYDFRNGDLNVTIKDLKKSDSGTYWCGVERVGLDTYQEVYLTVTDAPSTTKPSTFTPKTHVITSLSNIYGTSPNVSTMFQTTGAGLMVWTSVSLVVMVTVMGLVLALFCIKRRGSRRPTYPQLVYKNTKTAPSGEERGNKQPKPPQPVYYNTNTAPSGEERGNKQPKPPQPVYYNTNTAPSGEERGNKQPKPPQPVYYNTNTAPSGEERESKRPTPSSTAYSTINHEEVDSLYENTRKVVPMNSPNASTTYPADHTSTIYPADHTFKIKPAGHASTTYLAGHTSKSYHAGHTSKYYPAGHTSTTYPAGEVTSSSHFEIYVNVTDFTVLRDSCVMK